MELIPRLLAIHDSVMVIAPPGWANASIGNAAQQVSVDADRFFENRPERRVPLGIDPGMEFGRLKANLDGLRGELRRGGIDWRGPARCARSTRGEAIWRLCDDTGRVVAEQALGCRELSRLTVTDDLMDALRAELPPFEKRESELYSQVGEIDTSQFDEETSSVTVYGADGRVTLLVAKLLGVYTAHEQTWTWAWALPEPPPARTRVVEKACHRDARPLRVLTDPNGAYEQGFVDSFTKLVAARLGADAMWAPTIPHPDILGATVGMYLALFTP
jgi:hypothetical protein